jgi:predicted O-methyltransferase YrrM
MAFAETWLPEDEPLTLARQRAEEVGVVAVSPGAGAALRLLAAATGARAAVETGTGTGVSTLWILRGMHPDGVLTSIESEPEHQRLARSSLREAGVASGRTRLIAGQALDVLPRLSDGGYDLVHLDAAPGELDAQFTEALRLLRPGGVVAVSNIMWRGRVGDPGARDADTVAVRSLGSAVREREDLVAALLPVGDGILAAVKR